MLVSVLVLTATASAQSSQGGTAPSSPIAADEVRDAQARFGALRAAPSTDVTVTSETVRVTCREAPDVVVVCDLEARWTLVSSHAQRTQLYASVVGVDEVRLASPASTTESPSVTPLTVELLPDQPLEIALTGRARLPSGSGLTDGLDARHLVLATPRNGPHTTLLYTRAVARTFAATPASPTFTLGFEQVTERYHARALDVPFTEEPLTLPTTLLRDRASIPLRIEREGGFPLRNGGPMIGLGGTFDHGFRGRIGYEIGIDELVIVSVAFDSDFSDLVALGVLLEVATPSFGVPPSLSAGAGFVQRWRVNDAASIPASSAGLRLEVGAVLAVVGIVASFDYFPDDAAFTSSLLGRLSL